MSRELLLTKATLPTKVRIQLGALRAAKSYTVTFCYNDGEKIQQKRDPQSMETSGDFRQLPREGFVFDGWVCHRWLES